VRSIDLRTDEAVEIVGALDVDVTATGLAPRRLPAWTRPQIPDVLMDAMVAMTSGVRLRFRTDSERIELDAKLTTFRYAHQPHRPVVCQLVVDGGEPIDAPTEDADFFVFDPARPDDIGFVPGGMATLAFDGLGGGDKQCELWLPHAASVELRGLRIDDGATLAEPRDTGRRRWLHYGSSISHCIEADVPTGTWPAVAARDGGVDLHSLGLAGQCLLDPFVARTMRNVPADVISLKVGINIVNGDTMRERTFGPAVHGFLDTIREGHPDAPLLVVSPIICPMVEDRPGPTIPAEGGAFIVVDRPAALAAGALTLTRIRELLVGIVGTRRSLGDANLSYLDGRSLFGAADLADLPDGLHPNAAGYRRMGQRFADAAFAPGGPLAG